MLEGFGSSARIGSLGMPTMTTCARQMTAAMTTMQTMIQGTLEGVGIASGKLLARRTPFILQNFLGNDLN